MGSNYSGSNQYLLSVLASISKDKNILYQREGIIPGTASAISLSYISGEWSLSADVTAVSTPYKKEGYMLNTYRVIHSGNCFIGIAAEGEYQSVYIDLAQDRLTLGGVQTAASPTALSQYIYRNYSGYPWDIGGNMPILRTALSSIETPPDKIYIGHVLCYKYQGTKYYDFIPQYASMGYSNYTALVLPGYVKVPDGAGSNLISFPMDSNNHTLQDYVNDNTVLLLDHTAQELPLSIKLLEVDSLSAKANDISTMSPINKIGIGGTDSIYNGNPPYRLGSIDQFYPYYLGVVNDSNTLKWAIKVIDSGESTDGYKHPIDAASAIDLSSSYVYVNYVIMTIIWGGVNIGLYPGKEATG